MSFPTDVFWGRFGWTGGTAPEVPAFPRVPEAARLESAECVRYAIIWQVLSFLLICAQLVLVCVFGWPALSVGIVALTVLYAHRQLAGMTVLLQILLYQNWFLSVFSGLGLSPASFSVTIGTGFIATGAVAALAVSRMIRAGGRSDPVIRLVYLVGAVLAIVLLYTAYGAVRSTPISAATYFRNTTAMLLALLVGLHIGRSWEYRTFAIIFLTSTLFGMLLSAAELFFPHGYYEGISALNYFNLKLGGTGRTDLAQNVNELITARDVTWFNITGGAGKAVSVRLLGPNMHSISYAYVLAVGGVIALTLARPGLVALAIGLLVMAGIKGALLMLSATTALFALWAVTKRRSLVLVASAGILVAYIASGIVIGLANGDFHVVGFLGGVNGFIRVPLGHGIGVGGNLSNLAASSAASVANWKEWQHFGADFALESAVGVLLYQMGIAAVAIYVPLVLLILRGFGTGAARRGILRKPRPIDALFIGVAVTLANGVFQEEAYSPYALGLLTLAAGIVFSNGVNLSGARSGAAA